MFLVLFGKHDCLFGMVGLWWCLVQLSLGEYGVVCVQYCRIQNVDAWCSSSLPGLDLVFVGFYLHNKNWPIFQNRAWKLEVPSVYNRNTDIYKH